MEQRCPVLMTAPEFPWQDGHACPREAWSDEGEDKCYFHSNLDKDPGEFLHRFEELANSVHGAGTLDCTRFVFPRFSLRAGFQFKSRVCFREAQFTKEVNFGGAQFTKEVNFGGAQFTKEANFRDVRFTADANFGDSQFTSDANFGDSQFTSDANFGGARFDADTNFRDVRFTADANFGGARFTADANFGGARFTADAYFRGARFTADAYFRGARFIEDANFGGARFDAHANFGRARFDAHANFQGVHFKADAFWAHTAFKGRAMFHRARFAGLADWAHAVAYPEALLKFSLAEVEGDMRFDDLWFPSPQQAMQADVAWRKLLYPEAADQSEYPAAQPDVRIDFSNVLTRDGARIRFQGIDALGDEAETRGRLDMSKIRFAHTDMARLQFQHVRWDGPAPYATRVGVALRRAQNPLRRMARRISFSGVRPLQDAPVLARVADEHFLRNLPGVTSKENAPAEGSDEAGKGLDPALVADIYKGLRTSYEGSLHYTEAGVFHVREMEMRRLERGQHAMNRAAQAPAWGRPLWWSWAWWRRNVSLLNAYRVTSNYGESFGRALLSIAMWFLGMAAFERWFREPLVDQFLTWDATGSGAWLAEWLHAAHTLLVQAIVLLPAQVAGDSATDFVARVVGIFLIATLLIALRRQFRR